MVDMIVDMDEAAVYTCPTYRMLVAAFNGTRDTQDGSDDGNKGKLLEESSTITEEHNTQQEHFFLFLRN